MLCTPPITSKHIVNTHHVLWIYGGVTLGVDFWWNCAIHNGQCVFMLSTLAKVSIYHEE